MNSEANLTNILALILLFFGTADFVSSNVLTETTAPLSPKETEKLMKDLALECNLPNITFIDLFDPFPDEKIRQDSKCAITCMLKELEVIKDHNRYNEKGVEHLIRLLPESIDSDQDVECDENDFGKECSMIAEKDECETGWSLFLCLLKVCNPRKNDGSDGARIIEKYF